MLSLLFIATKTRSGVISFPIMLFQKDIIRKTEINTGNVEYFSYKMSYMCDCAIFKRPGQEMLIKHFKLKKKLIICLKY